MKVNGAVWGWVGARHLPQDASGQMHGMTSAMKLESHGSAPLLGSGYGLASASHATHDSEDLACVVSGFPGFSDGPLNQCAQSANAAVALAEGYRQRGVNILNVMTGVFSLALFDKRSGDTLLAIDRTGSCSMVYTVVEDELIFGSRLDVLRRHPLVKSEPDLQALYHFLYFHMIPGPGTVYKSQFRLLPGQGLMFRKGRAELFSYWEMHFDETLRQPFQMLKATFLETLTQAVQSCSEGAATGAFLSGGTDSSTLAGLLGKVTGHPAQTYSIGFEAAGYDEMEYARIAASHFGTRHHEYYVTPRDVAQAVPLVAAAYDQPFGNSSAIPTYYCARLAREDGMERLLGGDGGDELFGGNARYAKQRVFSFYEALPHLLRKQLIEPMALSLPGGKGFMPVRKLKSYVEQAAIPLPARLETYNLLERLGPSTVFSKGFLAQVDTAGPLALLDAVYHSARAGTQLNRMLALDLKFTLADNDLPKVRQTCELAGVDVRFPMLDDEVVNFSARLDPALKLKGTRLRYFFKEALRGFLPDAILTKSKHGFGLPFGEWLRTEAVLQSLAHDNLQTLQSRGILRPGFVDELIALHKAHAGYYGTMIWVLMMLEQWFRREHPDWNAG